MKHRHLSTMVALPAALLFACAASAQMRPQTPPQPQTNPEQMPRTQPMPQTQTPPAIPPTTQTRQCANGTNCYNDNTNGMRGQSFSSLAGAKGYVTQAEAQHDPWLSSHFNRCDRNQDGKVTRAEYQQCHNQNTTGGQP